MRGLIIFFAVCALTAAMVPRERRAVNTDEGDGNTPKKKEICEPQTPCGWTIQGKLIRDLENITNNYCVCGPKKACILDDNNNTQDSNVAVFKCKLLGETPFAPS